METLIKAVDRSKIYDQFNITSYGFMPDKPVPRLTDEFEPWEQFLDQLPELNKNNQTRTRVMELPDFNWQNLSLQINF